MINRILLFLIILFVLNACSRDDRARVNIKLKNAKGETAYIDEMKLSGSREVAGKGSRLFGRVNFRIPMRNEGFYQLRFGNGISMVMVLVPGDKIAIEADMDDFHATKRITGSELTTRIAELHDSLRATIKILNSVKADFEDLDSLNHRYAYMADSIYQQYASLRVGYRKFTLNFILQDLTSLANIAALYQEYGEHDYVLNNTQDIQFFKLVTDSLTKYYPKVSYVRNLRDNYHAIFNRYQQSRLLQMATPIDEAVPDLTLPGVNGKLSKLSSLKGKTILLSFWSVNETESRKNTVSIQKVYKKYRHRGFEIYQVSIDTSISDWKKALAFEEIDWISVIDTAFPRSRTKMFYNVNTIPMNYLINSEQSEILAKNLSPEMLDRALSGVLKTN